MTLILITSDRLGEGDEALGRKLLGNFLAKLADWERPETLFLSLVNRGVFLSTEGSEVIGSLRAIEGRGARIRSCITCLEHYRLEDSLAVGEIGTMAETVFLMGKAGKVVTL